MERIAPALIATLIRTLAATLRIRIHDPEGTLRRPSHELLIFALWHNRILLMPHIYQRHFPGRKGAAMTSASGDGGLLAQVLAHFEIGSVRGSSSKRGAEALIKAIRLMRTGTDICIIPDGPRGPRYSFAPGPIRLAMKCGAPILPLHFEYSRAWRLKSWDAFIIPKPFSRLDVTLLPPVHLPAEPPPGQELEAYLMARAAEIRQLLLAPLTPQEILDAQKPDAARKRAKRDTRLERDPDQDLRSGLGA